MEKEYLSIKKASEKYKASSSTITRFARQNQKTNFVKKENGKYLISDSLLKANFEKVENHAPVEIQTSNQSEPKTENSNEKVINFLQSQNEFLQSQIVKKDNQIDKLLERQFEQNTIIQTLQNRFDVLGKQIDNSTLLISEKVTKKNEVGPGRSQNEKGNDNGFTIASAVMILLLVVVIIIFLTVK